MLKKIKTLLALLLLLCLFLPLAQCTSTENQLVQEKQVTYQVFQIDNLQFNGLTLIPLFIFALPLLLLLSRWFVLRWRVRYFIVDSLANALVLLWLWLLQLMHQWLYGAWLALALSLAMLAISVLEIVVAVRANRQKSR